VNVTADRVTIHQFGDWKGTYQAWFNWQSRVQTLMAAPGISVYT